MKIRILILTILCAFIALSSVTANAKKTVKVGVYQNIPLTFIEEDGSVKGFFIDILEHIAAEEDWDIEYVPDSWAGCLEKLKNGKTDLLGVIAFSRERNKVIDYTYESVLTEWGQIYANREVKIESILDLRGKKIAVLQEDMHFTNLRELMAGFGNSPRFIETFEYEDVMKLTETGISDAGLVSQFYGGQYERDYDIAKTSVILSPEKLYWAAPKDIHPMLLHALDEHLRSLKKDENSIYYQSLNRWFGIAADSKFGIWIKWIGIGASVLLTLFILASLVLSAQVKSRTKELHAKNKALLEEIESRKQAESESIQLEDKLRRSQKMEALGTLAGGVAHDLNNILSGIVSYPELLLLDLPKDSPLRKPIITIKESGERAAAIVQDLLTLARRGVAVTEVVNLNNILGDYLASAEFKKLKENHSHVRFYTKLADNLLNISGSPIHLTKTVMNLIFNAYESITTAGVVTISTENRYIDRPIRGYDNVEEGDYTVLTISDTGIGIAPIDMERIFEPFYTKKIMGRSGSGLGMAVVWGTVKDHQGYIDVSSTEGSGTSFHLYFPVARQALSDKQPIQGFDDLAGNGETILIVDDVEQQRQIASDMLSKLGYSVDSVASGEEAVTYLEKQNADLLVLDMIMAPGMDGLETYKKILESKPKQKAIIASGFSENFRVKAAQQLGAGTYVKKPYSLENIGQAVKEELARA